MKSTRLKAGVLTLHIEIKHQTLPYKSIHSPAATKTPHRQRRQQRFDDQLIRTSTSTDQPQLPPCGNDSTSIPKTVKPQITPNYGPAAAVAQGKGGIRARDQNINRVVVEPAKKSLSPAAQTVIERGDRAKKNSIAP